MVIVSGLPPSNGGVGRLIKHLKLTDSKVIFKKDTVSLKKVLNDKKYFIFLKLVIIRFYFSLSFKLRFISLIGRDIIVIHPQTVGYVGLFFLAIFSRISVYVMDCSFFCIKSYNYHESAGGECLKCVSFGSEPYESCTPIPVRINKHLNRFYLKILYKLRHRCKFLAQNYSQKKLLHLHFGNNIDVVVIGLNTGELHGGSSIVRERKEFDVVFHGSLDECKGVIFFLKLAAAIPELSFFLPYERKLCQENIPDFDSIITQSKNVFFRNCFWESGLREIVINSTFTVVPSAWSMPIEGALLKSIYYGKFVVIKKTMFGFDNDLFLDDSIIRVGDDLLYCRDVLMSKIDKKIPERRLMLRRERLVGKYVENDYFSK